MIKSMSQASALLEMQEAWCHHKPSVHLRDHASSMLMRCGALFQCEEPVIRRTVPGHASTMVFMSFAGTLSKIKTSDAQDRVLK